MVVAAVHITTVIVQVVKIEYGFTKFGTTPGGGAKAGNIASSAGVGSIFALVCLYSVVVKKHAKTEVWRQTAGHIHPVHWTLVAG